MLRLSATNLLRASLAGLGATFAMTWWGLRLRQFGLARLDPGGMLARRIGHGRAGGDLAHYGTGVLLALAYARWLEPLRGGPRVFKGLLYGVITTLLADGLVTPFLDPRLGPFFRSTPHPNLLRLSSLAVHLIYGLTLGLVYLPKDAQ